MNSPQVLEVVVGKGKTKRELILVKHVLTVKNGDGSLSREGEVEVIEPLIGSSLENPYSVRLLAHEVTVDQNEFTNPTNFFAAFAVGQGGDSFEEAYMGSINLDDSGRGHVLAHTRIRFQAGFSIPKQFKADYQDSPLQYTHMGDKVKLSVRAAGGSNGGSLVGAGVNVGVVWIFEKKKVTRSEYVESLAIRSCSC